LPQQMRPLSEHI